jgi:GAF domain-containing protein
MKNSRSKSEEFQLGRTLAVLNEIAQSLPAVQAPDKVLKKIAGDAKDLLGADIIDLYEFYQNENRFVLPPIMVGERLNPHVPEQVYNDDVVRKIIKAGKPKYFSDAQKATLLTEEFEMPRSGAPQERFVFREGIVSSASLPLKAGSETVGVMFVNYRTRQAFETEQRDLIESFSNLAAIAINNARVWKIQKSQIDALYEIINITATATTTEGGPLQAILKQAVDLFSVKDGSISQLTEDGRYLQHTARWREGKFDSVFEESSYEPFSKGITGHVLRTGKIFRTGNVNKVEFYDPSNSDTKSELTIPLKNMFGGTIGVLDLESDKADFFTEEDEKLGESFANAVSAVIRQSDLIEDMQALHYLTESHSLKDLIKKILENLVRKMGNRTNTATSINLYDSTNDEFYAFDGIGPDPKFVEEYLLIPPRRGGKETGTGQYVLENRKPLFYDDINNIPDGLPKVRSESKRHQIVSFAVLPLIYQDDIVGTLFIQRIRDRIKFTDDVKGMLSSYASQAALAIHNAQRLVSVNVLDELLKATVKESESRILDLIVKKTVEVIGSDYASIWLGEDKTDDLLRKAVYIKPGEEAHLKEGVVRLKNGEPSVNMIAFKEKKAVIEGDVSQAEKEGRYHRIYMKARSELAVPLILQDKALGTLNTESQYPHAFSNIDRVTLRIFADIAAVAIKVVQDREEIKKEVDRKTREIQEQNEEIQKQNQEIKKRSEDLFHMNYRLERRNAGFEALAEIGQQLTANVQRGEHEILSIIQEQASRIMDTDNMYIALYEPNKDEVHFELAFIDGKPVDVKTEKGWGPRSGGNGRTEWIIRKKTPILTYTKADAENWYRQSDNKNYISQTFASWLGVPIMFGEEVLGVIATYHKTQEYKYDPDDVKILSLMGRQAAIALQNARLIKKLDTVRELGEDLSSSLSI